MKSPPEPSPELERKLAMIEAMAGVGHWRMVFATQHITWSAQVYEIHGVDPQTFDPNLQASIDAYHPEDRPALVAFIQRAEETGAGFAFKMRLRRFSDGATRIVTSRGEVERDAYGAPVALFGVFQDVTDREQAIEKIAEALADAEAARLEAVRSEERFRALTENGSDVVMQSDLEGRLVYISPSVTSLVGYRPEEMIGRETLSFIHQEDAPRIRAEVEACIRSRGKIPLKRFESRMRHKDGRVLWLETGPALLIDPKTNHIIGTTDVVRDITRRKTAEENAEAALAQARQARQAAEASEALYRLLADHSTDIIVRAGPNGIVRYASPSVAMLGISAQDAIGRSTLEFVAPEDKAYATQLITDLFSGAEPDRAVRREYRVLSKDGTRRWMEGNPSLVRDENGAPIEFITVFRDVTARRAMEEDLARALDAAQEATHAKADFLATMSHELRTPLNSIIGFSRLLQRSGNLPSREQRYADHLITSSEGLLTIVNDVLDFSSLEARGVRLEERPFAILELVQRIADSLRPQSDSKHLSLNVRHDGDAPPLLVGDEVRLGQILINLVGNAIKFTDAGRVDIVTTYTTPDDGRPKFRCAVQDTGIGIPADRREALFVRFTQVDNSINRRFGGSGLGLAIVRHLIELMGGAVGFTSLDGQVGSTFWFEIDLPVANAFAGIIDAAENDTGDDRLGAQAMAEAPRRLLVVDDVDINRELVAALLAGTGHHIDVVEDGTAAVRHCADTAYDLVLMDVQMPGMDGLAATRAIRSAASGARVPIVAMTAQALPTQIAACRDAGMDDHLSKPITATALHAIIETWTGQRTQSRDDIRDEDMMGALRTRFVARCATDLERIRALVADATTHDELVARVHRLAGTAGTFGFADVGDAALALDERLMRNEAPVRNDFADLLLALERLCAAT